MPPQRLSLTSSQMASPIGTLQFIADDHGRLRALDWDDHEARMHTLLQRYYRGHDVQISAGAAPRPIRMALEAYFAGDLTAIDSIAVETGGTTFQRAAWAALRQIPAGKTASYRDQAERIGRPSAVRAVGLANGANPVGLVVPCHRVIGADGSLTGYGGGLERKRWLLTHEGALSREVPPQAALF